MQLRRILLLLAAVLLAGCFKEVSYKTTYILQPRQQQASGEASLPIADARAYAFNADTTLWTVASYDDALAGIITSKSLPAERQTAPIATTQPYEQEGTEGWIQMALSRESQMVVLVDPVNKFYAYTQQALGINLPKLYVSVLFKPWKEGFSFRDGSWSFYNQFYKPPVLLQCFLAPTAQTTQDGAAAPIASANLKAYAFAADTTNWYLASYNDAVAGKITSKTGLPARTNPDFQAYPVVDTDLYSMNVSKSVLMVVVVDRLHKLYAYSKQEVNLEGTSPTFSILFRPWQKQWISIDDGWRVVDEQQKPKPQTPQQ